jgi:hypothetical protein
MSRVKRCRARRDFARVVGLRLWHEFCSWLPLDKDNPDFDWPWKNFRESLVPDFKPIVRDAWEKYWSKAQRVDLPTYQMLLAREVEITNSGYSRLLDAATIKEIIRNIRAEITKGDGQCINSRASC